jgi:hypothetical protein
VLRDGFRQSITVSKINSNERHYKVIEHFSLLETDAQLRFYDLKSSVVVTFSHFQLLQNHHMPSHRTYHKSSSMCLEEVLYLFEGVRVMVFNASLYNISVISWRSALLVEETRENFITLCCIEYTSSGRDSNS